MFCCFFWFAFDSNFIYYSNWLDVYTHIWLFSFRVCVCVLRLIFASFFVVMMKFMHLHLVYTSCSNTFVRHQPLSGRRRWKKNKSTSVAFLRFELICFHSSSFRAIEMNGRRSNFEKCFFLSFLIDWVSIACFFLLKKKCLSIASAAKFIKFFVFFSPDFLLLSILFNS